MNDTLKSDVLNSRRASVNGSAAASKPPKPYYTGNPLRCCDCCEESEPHYCKRFSRPMKNMDVKVCRDWLMRLTKSSVITALKSTAPATLMTPESPVLGGDSQQRLVSRHDPKRINNFSGGLCSFWSAWRDVQEVGPENVVLLFADTLVEADDLYQFLKDASALLGVPVTRVSREITPWQLFRQERMIGNNKYPICSVKLKREVLDGWMAAHYEMNRDQSNMLLPKATLSIGFDWTEEHRLQDMRNEHPMWDIRAPMQEGEIWDKCRMEREAAKLGLKIADAYVQGFPHNNCGKRCVRAGISHWVHLYHTDRPAFMSWAVEEWDCKLYLETLGIVPLSMLKDRRGGETNNLYLLDLKKRIDAGEQFDKHEWGGCGCGGASAMPANDQAQATRTTT